MSGLIFYLSIALVCWQMDAAMTYVAKKKFRALPSMFCCLLWPVMAPVVILSAQMETRGFPEQNKRGTQAMSEGREG